MKGYLSFDEWKALHNDSGKSEEDLKDSYDEADQDEDGELDLEEYQSYVKAEKAKLEDPQFKKFYEADTTEPKDEKLTFD